MTGLDPGQLEALKHGFEGFDKENAGFINATQMQMIFKMMGVQVQVSSVLELKTHPTSLLKSVQAAQVMYNLPIKNDRFI